MAAATVNRRRSVVFGNKRIILADVTTTTSSDTFVTGLKIIDSASVESSTTGVAGATKSGGTLTIVSSAGIANILVVAVGS